ncbi:MAG: hypothetical protein M3270_03770 [Thermoproteota archaeon]|nr:hypothetical protein [Thermoproteota archaeon]
MKETQQAFDTVRVIGNNAIHPGQIDLKDDIKTALSLFKLVNIIVEDMITEPNDVASLFNGLPDGIKKGIDTRGGGNNNNSKVH